jgi:hypothetical protein
MTSAEIISCVESVSPSCNIAEYCSSVSFSMPPTIPRRQKNASRAQQESPRQLEPSGNCQRGLNEALSNGIYQSRQRMQLGQGMKHRPDPPAQKRARASGTWGGIASAAHVATGRTVDNPSGEGKENGCRMSTHGARAIPGASCAIVFEYKSIQHAVTRCYPHKDCPLCVLSLDDG